MIWDFHKLTAEAMDNLAALEANAEGLQFNADAMKIAQSSASRKSKLIGLYAIGDAMSKRITPHSACRNGCNHCCKQAVSVTVLEAREIARFTGREYVQPKPSLSLEQTQEKYMGVPCTFLVDGKCSVYPVRPISCRVYFNMSDTPEICDNLKYPSQSLPCLNAQGVQFAQSIALGTDFHDIRQWFPDKNT